MDKGCQTGSWGGGGVAQGQYIMGGEGGGQRKDTSERGVHILSIERLKFNLHVVVVVFNLFLFSRWLSSSEAAADISHYFVLRADITVLLTSIYEWFGFRGFANQQKIYLFG